MVGKTYSFEAELRAETDLAILLEVDGNEKWFPRSQIEEAENGWWTVPEWLAIEKEII